ncbi:uncharacterized [Tachysurus ichikawai]
MIWRPLTTFKNPLRVCVALDDCLNQYNDFDGHASLNEEFGATGYSHSLMESPPGDEEVIPVHEGCLTDKRELTGTLCCKEHSFPSRSVWQSIYCKTQEGFQERTRGTCTCCY